jgi:hypothetical protein
MKRKISRKINKTPLRRTMKRGGATAPSMSNDDKVKKLISDYMTYLEKKKPLHPHVLEVIKVYCVKTNNPGKKIIETIISLVDPTKLNNLLRIIDTPKKRKTKKFLGSAIPIPFSEEDFTDGQELFFGGTTIKLRQLTQPVITGPINLTMFVDQKISRKKIADKNKKGLILILIALLNSIKKPDVDEIIEGMLREVGIPQEQIDAMTDRELDRETARLQARLEALSSSMKSSTAGKGKTRKTRKAKKSKKSKKKRR